jgi:hypothetical protein
MIAPGHAIWNLCGDPAADASWYLRGYQRGEPRFYLEHIRRAVELTAADAASLLVFSGGQTFPEAGPRSEAFGYWALAEHFAWWGAAEVRARSILEDFSRDSFDNVLYSICRFREFTGAWPQRITVAGWGFKAPRFAELHRAALRFPAERFHYVAVNDPPDLATAARGEAEIRAAFAADPYGCGAVLAEKREARNPYRTQHGFRTSCPELAALLDHRGPEMFAGPLPWG